MNVKDKILNFAEDHQRVLTSCQGIEGFQNFTEASILKEDEIFGSCEKFAIGKR